LKGLQKDKKRLNKTIDDLKCSLDSKERSDLKSNKPKYNQIDFLKCLYV